MVTLGDSDRKTIDELAKIAYYRHLLTALLSCSVVSFVLRQKVVEDKAQIIFSFQRS